MGRISDFDVAVVNPDLLKKAQNLNLGKTGRSYSDPLKLADMESLGFGNLANKLSKQYGREVNFRIFENVSSLREKGGARFKIPCN